MSAEPRTVAEGLGFPEAPRWHDGHLWISDMAAREVVRLDGAGRRVESFATGFRPSGLGWLPDGTTLVVAMDDQTVMRRDGDGWRIHAELGHLISAPANDMVCVADGTCYVTNLGYAAGVDEPRTTTIVAVHPDGRAEALPGALWRPNGIAVTAEGTRLYVAETRVHRISAFDRGPDGTLCAQAVVAELPSGTWADGICLDAEGGIWVGDPKGHACYRVVPGEGVTDRIDTGPAACVACMLGGADRTTLYLALGDLGEMDASSGARRGRVDAIEVTVPGAGWP